MREEFFYKIYGLNLKSEIQLSEAVEIKDFKGQVHGEIRYGVIDEDLKQELRKKIFLKVDKDNTWMYVKNVATFHVKDGREIIVDSEEDLNLIGIKSYILGTILGHFLYQRGFLAIHGGSVVIDNEAVIIVGESGSGKSTFTTALRQRGYNLVTDDIAALDIKDRVYVHPGYPGQRLCDNVMKFFKYDLKDFLRIDLDHKVKYMIPTWKEFVYEKTRLGVICELQVGDVKEPIIEEVKGKNKIDLLYNNAYTLRWVKHLGMKPEYIRQCILVAKGVKIYRITRPREGFTVEKQVELLEGVVSLRSKDEIA